MASIPVRTSKAHSDAAALIPAAVLKALPQDELLDRLAHAADLATRTDDPQLTEAYAQRSRAMLAAPPRDAVAKELCQRYVQANRAADPAKAAELRRSAERLIQLHPAAPTRGEALVVKSRQSARDTPGRAPVPVAKAKAKTSGEQVAVYNVKGELVGIVDPSAITPLTEPKPSIGNPRSLEPAPPGEAGTPAGVAKSAVAKAAELRNTFTRSTDPAGQNRAASEMHTAAIAGLTAIHGRGGQARRRS